MVAATVDLEQTGKRTWDVAVIGAGPGGALAARCLALGGASVLLVDRKSFPRAKVCGACLNRTALAALDACGLTERIEGLRGRALDRFELRVPGRKAKFPLPKGKAIPREVLDSALVEEAITAGAEFLPATRATLEPGQDTVRRLCLKRRGRSERARARIVVVASGLAGLERNPEPKLKTSVSNRSRIGVGCEVDGHSDAYGEGAIHMAVGRSGYVGLVRFGSGRLNVAAAFDRAFVRALGGPAAATEAVLSEAGCESLPGLRRAAWQGTVGLSRRTRPVAGHRLMCIGDAGGYVEPFTGEGMAAALTSARAAAPLVLKGVESWDPALAREWSRRYRRLIGRRQILCRGIALGARHPAATRLLLDVCVDFPALTRSLIEAVNSKPRIPDSS